MKNVIFKKVGMENFGPYTDVMELEFEPNKLILISGPNGVGKTMIFDAIAFCLYGITSKGARADDVVNNVIGKNCHTWLDFDIDNVKHRIDRYHKYKKHGSTVYLFKEDLKNPIKKGQKEVLPEIERMIAPRKLFMNTLMFGQKVKDFFTDLADSEKKEIFRKILELDNYILYYKKADERLKSISTQILELNNNIHIKLGLIDDAKIQIKHLKETKENFKVEKQSRLKILNDSIKKLKDTHDDQVLILADYEKQDLNTEDTLKQTAQIEKDISLIDSKSISIENDINNKKQIKEEELKSLALKAREKEIESIQKIIDDITSSYNRDKDKINIEVNKSINSKNLLENDIINIEIQIERNREDINEIIKNVIEPDISTCPTCKQKIGPKVIEDLKNKVTFTNNKVEELKITILEKKKEIEHYKLCLLTKSQELEKINQIFLNQSTNAKSYKEDKIQDIQQRLDNAVEKVEELVKVQLYQNQELYTKKKLQLIKNLEIAKEKLTKQKKLVQKKTETENSLRSINDSILNTQSLKEEKETETYDDSQLKSYIVRVKSLNIEIKDLENQRNQFDSDIKILEFWKTGCSSSGVPSMLIDEAIPYMNQRVAYYLDQISNGRYMVSFDTMSSIKSGEFRDKISVNMYDNETKANSQLQFSGGQTRIIDISTILTLSDLQARERGISFNILLFDEIMDSLDQDNIGFVSKVLRNIAKEKTICLISHTQTNEIEADITLNLN